MIASHTQMEMESQGSSNQKLIGQATKKLEQQIDAQRCMCMGMYFIEIIIVDIDHLKIHQIFLIYVIAIF